MDDYDPREDYPAEFYACCEHYDAREFDDWGSTIEADAIAEFLGVAA